MIGQENDRARKGWGKNKDRKNNKGSRKTPGEIPAAASLPQFPANPGCSTRITEGQP
jgi:hypothetical protein